MLFSMHLLRPRHCLPVHRFRRFVPGLVVQFYCQVVHARKCQLTAFSKHLLKLSRWPPVQLCSGDLGRQEPPRPSFDFQ
jgi:hypothetical protein